MSFVHSKGTVVKLGAYDLSGYGTGCEWERSADTHDATTWGKDDHVYAPGLKDGTSKITGLYDNTAGTWPRAVLNSLFGTATTLTHRPEGTGAGKPQDLVAVIVKKYTESSPVADMVKWSCELQHSDAVNTTAQ